MRRLVCDRLEGQGKGGGTKKGKGIESRDAWMQTWMPLKTDKDKQLRTETYMYSHTHTHTHLPHAPAYVPTHSLARCLHP